MKNLNNLNLKTREGLDMVVTTLGSNGKISQITPALIGFADDEFKEAERIADELGGTVTLLHKQDGQPMYERIAEVIEPIKPKEDNYGCDARFIQAGYYEDEAEFISEEMEEPDMFETLEELKERVEELEEIWKHYEQLKDNEMVLLQENRFDRILSSECMSGYYDTHLYIIGVVFDKELSDIVTKAL